MSDRNRQIDALRGLAAIAVVLYQSWWFGHGELAGALNLVGFNQEPSIQLAWGNLGVPLFFMISGLVMAHSAQRHHELRLFIRNRFARLYPAFILSVFLSYIVYQSCNLRLSGHFIPLSQILTNATMAAKTFGDYFINGAHWTLEIELQFYVIIGLAIASRTTSLLQLLLLSVVTADTALNISGGWDWIPGIWRLQQSIPFIGYASYFLAGVAIANFSKTPVISGLAILASLANYLVNSSYPGIPCIMILIVLWLSQNNVLKQLDNKPLVFLGTISYSLYLFHGPIGYPIIIFLQDDININLLVLLAVSASIAGASLICFYFELPLYKRIRKKKRQSQATQ